MLIALDLATNIGECFGEPDALPTLGHHRLPSTGEDVGAFLCAFEDWLWGRLEKVCPTVIVFEAPVLPRAKYNKDTKKVEGGVSLLTTRKLQGLAGVLEMVAHREGLECVEVQPAEAKQALTGKGNAKKPEMIAAARALGFDPFVMRVNGEDASDEADALGVFVRYLKVRHPDIADGWAPKLSASAPLFAGAAA